MRSASCCASPRDALGVATERGLRDYFRLRPAMQGRASPSWSRPASCSRSRSRAGTRAAYLDAGAARSRGAWRRSALLAPFDPLIWQRERTEALFGSRIRHRDLHAAREAHARLLRAAVPAGDRIVARVDLKADRAGLDPARAGGARRARRAKRGNRRPAGGRAAPDGGLAGARADPRRAPRRYRRRSWRAHFENPMRRSIAGYVVDAVAALGHQHRALEAHEHGAVGLHAARAHGDDALVGRLATRAWRAPRSRRRSCRRRTPARSA